MKKFLLAVTLLTAGSTALLADSVVYLQGSVTNPAVMDGNYYVSPYTGSDGVVSLANHSGGLSVELFCDDFSHDASFGQTWNAHVTAITASSATLSANTRFGASNPATPYPSGTQLYEELAWLYTQAIADVPVSGAASTSQAEGLTGIQEAAWHLTYSGTQPTTAQGGTGSVYNNGTHNTQDYTHWIAAAAADYNNAAASTAAGYQALVASDWYVVTPTNYAVTGSTQEFLAYTTSSGVPGTGQNATTPEPASFALFGGGLVVLGLFARRKKQSAL